MSDAEDIAMPQAAEFVARLTAEYGREYSAAFIGAVEAKDREDHHGLQVGLDTAIAVLVSAGWTREQSREIARSHRRFVHAAIQADLQASVDSGGAWSGPRRPGGGELA